MVNSMVERATSGQLIGPDWAMNIDICDILNKDPGQAKDVVKGVKKRIGSKNPKAQLLALTLLETIVKNCGDIVHMHVAEKEIPHDMVKITKKKPDFQVKEKILTLIDTWQEAFGGPRARYPQYYAAYQELLRAGAVFPTRSESSAPVFTPPQTQPLSSYPPNLRNLSNTRQETAEPSSEAEFPSLSLTEIQNSRGIMDVLAEMLSAIDPANKENLRQEVILDLVEQCRAYKQRVVHLVNSTSDESLLCQGLALNDDLQKVLAKHEALASGTFVPQDKSKPESSKSLVDVAAPMVDTGENNKKADEGTHAGRKIPGSLVNGSAATPKKADPQIDLLSGDLLGDDFSSTTPQDALALVPISAPQSSSPVASQQNALALIDMFSTTSSTPSSSNSQPPTSAGQAYPGQPNFQQHQDLQLPHSIPYANGSMRLPQYEQSGYPPTGWNPQVAQQQPQPQSPAYGAYNAQVASHQPHPQSLSPGYGALNVLTAQQQQPQSPVYGAQNGGAFPPPPWEAQQAEMNQPFSPNQSFSPNQHLSHNQPFSPPYSPSMQVSSMAGQQSPTFQGGMHPFAPQPTGNEQAVGMYPQQIAAGGFMPGMSAQHMPNQMPGMNAQHMPNQMPGMNAQHIPNHMTGMNAQHIPNQMPGMNAQHMSNQMPGMYPHPYQGGAMMVMPPQAMQATQMGSMYPAQMYGNQMVGYGYGYAQQPNAQYLDQRMHGLSLRDDSALRTSSSQSSMASYLPPMRQQPKGDDKLFGDLVDMAKLKPKPNNPNRTGSV